MSPQAGVVLMQDIAPRLKAVMPHIKTVGAEDCEELLQDALLMAARMLDNLEKKGKRVTPGNVAYYTILHIKSGRRNGRAGRTDVMASATQLDHKSCVLSFEEPAGIDPETGDEIPLGEMLAGNWDDPSLSASRNVDWEEFLNTHDHRYGEIIYRIGVGKRASESAKDSRRQNSRVRKLKEKLADEQREYLGPDAIADSARIPAWRGNIMVDHEKAACRADRRRER